MAGDKYHHSIKVHTKRTRICINWNPHFQTQVYLAKVSLNVSIVKQNLLHKKQFLKILWIEVGKKGFQLMLILVLLGIYFDAVVVFVTSKTLSFRLALAILWYQTKIFVLYFNAGSFFLQPCKRSRFSYSSSSIQL